MIRLRCAARFCVVPAFLFAATVAAQDAAPAACAGGAADEDGMRIALTLPGSPEHAAGVLDAALRAQAYSVVQPPAAAGAWNAEPRHTWLPAHAEAIWHGAAHPGVQLSGVIQAMGDSSEVTVLARTLCRPEGEAGPLGRADDLLERFSALDLMQEVEKRSERGFAPFQMQIPTRVGEFAFQGSTSDSSKTMLYGAMNGTLSVVVNVFPSGMMYARCTPSCAEVLVQQVVANQFRETSRLRATVTFRSLEPLVPGPGDHWQAGRYAIHEIVSDDRSRTLHLYVYAFPTHLVMFRGFVDTSPGGAERVRAFVVTALASGMDGSAPPAAPRRRGGPSAPELEK